VFPEHVQLDLNQRDGRVFAKSQIIDYVCRGELLAQYNVLRFFVETYDENIKTRNENVESTTSLPEFECDGQKRRRGRPRHVRVRYLEGHPKFDTTQ
jgi:hypothetical protein